MRTSGRRVLVMIVSYLGAVAGIMSEGTTNAVLGSRGNDRQRPQQYPKKNHDRTDSSVSCQVALCLSGAIRSFVHPVVHSSIRRNLIEAIEADGCEVDVFAYATRQDTVELFEEKSVNIEFTPTYSDVEAALAVLKPTKLVWHQEQAGVVQNSCGVSRGQAGSDPEWWEAHSRNLYWQLYKSLAAYRMALREEKQKGSGYTYDWIIRGRFDMAWVRPLPPLRSFSQKVAWFGRRHWPMSDHFALVPRSFSDRYFTAVRAFYACHEQSWPPSLLWWQPKCNQGFEESVLFRHLHAADVPYRFYPMFEYVITRGKLGGVCESGTAGYRDVCGLVEFGKGFQAPFTSQDCVEALAMWAELRCQTLLPAAGMNAARRVDATLVRDRRAWEDLVVNPSTAPTSTTRADAEAEDMALERAAEVIGVAAAAAATVARLGTIAGYDAKVVDAVNAAAVGVVVTTVPEVEDLDLALSKLVALREALLVPPDHGFGFDSFEDIKSSRPKRWDGWEYFPRWWSYWTCPCPLAEPLHLQRTMHLVMYYNLGDSLATVMTQAFKCFLDELLFEGTKDERDGFDRSLCERTSPLESVMIAVGLHTEVLGLCTMDGRLGVDQDDYGQLFFGEPEAHCVGYGRLDTNTTTS